MNKKLCEMERAFPGENSIDIVSVQLHKFYPILGREVGLALKIGLCVNNQTSLSSFCVTACWNLAALSNHT